MSLSQLIGMENLKEVELPKDLEQKLDKQHEKRMEEIAMETAQIEASSSIQKTTVEDSSEDVNKLSAS